jgi:hypothetical protein
VYRVSENHLEDTYIDIRYKELEAVIQDARTYQVYGIVEVCLAQAPDTWYTNGAYAAALQEGWSEAPSFGVRLAETCSSLAEVFSHGRTIGKLARVEMRPRHPLKGYGIEMASRVLHLVRRRFGMVAFLIQPFPLQYTKGTPALDDRARAQAIARFEDDKSKLVHLYENAWGAQHLHGGYMVASLTHKVAVSRGTRKWSLSERLTPR